MANFTKQAINHSFLKLLNERSLDQITVKYIVEDCGINRKTFYYYYQDIFAIIDEFTSNELMRIKAELPADVSWQTAQKALANAMLKNRNAMLHITRPLDDTILYQSAYDLIMQYLPQFIRQKDGGADIDESDVLLIANLNAMALAGFHVRWVRDGMKDDPNAMIDRVAAVMAGTTELAIQNAARLKREG